MPIRALDRLVRRAPFRDRYEFLLAGSGKGAALVLDVLAAAGRVGVTTEHIITSAPPGFACSPASVRTAIRTLVAAHIIEPAGTVHRVPRGRRATVFRLTAGGRRVLALLDQEVA
jgi:hypothetical protein